MRYRLDELTLLAATFDLKAERRDENRLDVIIHDGCRLTFYNLPQEDDTLVGFDGTPWHSHGLVQFSTGEGSYVECDELSVLTGLAAGELVVVTQYVDGQLRDRWLAHKDEPLELQYMASGEELRVLRLRSQRRADGP